MSELSYTRARILAVDYHSYCDLFDTLTDVAAGDNVKRRSRQPRAFVEIAHVSSALKPSRSNVT